jgi:hypothetical protein
MENEEYNKQLMELLMKYEHKEIDDKTYKEEYAKLINSKPLLKDIHKNKQFLLSKNLIYIIIFSVLLIIILTNFVSTLVGKEYIAADLNNIDEPIQVPYNGIDDLQIGSIDAEVDLNYSYEISGKVVATFKYLPITTGNRMSPMDVGIVWGDLIDEENLKHIKWHETGTRFLHWETKDGTWYQEFGSVEGLYSNNHLVPSNNKAKNMIKKIKRGDYIKITGYLVDIFWEERNRSYSWHSSITRNDQGDGACELIYVTDVKWLKENK